MDVFVVQNKKIDVVVVHGRIEIDVVVVQLIPNEC